MESAIPQRVMVTGSAGFLGGAVVDRLMGRPDVERVVGVDVVGTSPRDPRHVAVERDVAEGTADLLAEHRVDSVVHHAYLVRPPRDVAAARRVNVAATERLVEEASAAGVARIVYPSSTTVYGARPGAAAHTERDTPRPEPGFVYSEHKVAAERALRALGPDGTAAVILRCCVVAGPGAAGFILASLSLPVLPLVAGADPELQFLHVADYCDAVEAALAAPGPGTYNVAGRGTVRAREMAELVGSRVVSISPGLLRGVIRWSWRLRLQHRSPESGLAFITHPWVASTEKAAVSLGWAPRHTSREAIAAWSEWRRGAGPGMVGAETD